MPIDLHRVRQLNTEYYTNVHQEANNAPQQQLPQPEQHEQQQRHPILRNAVQLPEDAVLNEPTDEVITNIYSQIGITLEDSKRRKLLTESRKRFARQNELATKATQQQNRPGQLRNVTLKDAVKLSDSDLIKNFGKYSGQDRYLFLRYSLLSNRYYALLPEEATFKLSREEIMSRLSRLYAVDVDQRNGELITFYENIIRLKEMEESLKEQPQEEVVPNENAITEEERTKNAGFYDRNVAQINGSHVAPALKQQRIRLMEKIMRPGNDPEVTFLQPSSVEISAEQKEGMRQILAWMYRNCNKSSVSKLGFVHNLASSKPEQILLALYLVEKGKTVPAGDEFYEATHGYVPNFVAFKSRVVASKWKFWKRMHSDSSDSVINWNVIGSAVRYATNPGTDENPSDIVNYERYNGRIKNTRQALDNMAENSPQRRDSLVELLQHKGNLILTYYRSAGLSPDMPVDMIPNQAMRAEVQQLLQEIRDDIQEVYVLTEQQLPDVNYANVGGEKKNGVKEPGSTSAVISAFKTVVKPLSVITAADIGIGLTKPLISGVEEMMKAAGYTAPTLSVKGVSGLLGIILALHSIVGVATSASGLTRPDHTAQAMQVAGTLINSLGGGLKTAIAVAGKFTDLGTAAQTANPSWYGSLSIRPISKSLETVSSTAEFAAGSAALVAGTVMTIAGGIQLGRVRSSKNDLQRVETALDQKHAPSPREMQLRRFMNHERRSLADQKRSGIVQTISGVLTTIGGALTMSGILAPLGGVLGLIGIGMGLGAGLHQARRKKNKTIKASVDEVLNIKDADIQAVKNSGEQFARLGDDEVRSMIRQEKLAELGYATYKECFAESMKEHAILLYDEVMNHRNGPDHAMYLDALKSLGMKINMDKKIPTASAIYAKLMK